MALAIVECRTYLKVTVDKQQQIVGENQMLSTMYGHAGAIVSFACQLLACKNVSWDTHDAPDKVQKKRRRNGKKPLARYHTLRIDPLNKGQRGDSNRPTQKVGDTALHLCRGHFKDYRNGQGLFGKYHDLYWFSPALRGSADNGTVSKDYFLK